MTIHMIAALGEETRTIGKDNDVIWKIPADMKRFRTLTSGHPVIMGRKTWDSLPEQFRPLPKRMNIVLSRTPGLKLLGAYVTTTIESALHLADHSVGGDETFIIGGGQLYFESLNVADVLNLTLVDSDAKGDTHFPPYKDEFSKVLSDETGEHEGLRYRFLDLARA